MKKLARVSLVILPFLASSAFAAPGFYVGLGGGYSNLKSSLDSTVYVPGGNGDVTIHFAGDGAYAKLFTGYGWQADSGLYFGTEISADYASAHSSNNGADYGSGNVLENSSSTRIQNGPGARISIHPGYYFSQSTMAYLEAGYGADQFKITQKVYDTDPVINYSKTSTNWRGGYDVGAGFQANMSQTLALRLEANETFYPAQITINAQNTDQSFTATYKLKPRVTSVGLSVVYTFGADEGDDGLINS